MVPRRVLQNPPLLPSATMSFTNNIHTTGTAGENIISFESYQLMEVGTSSKAIWVPAALLILKKIYYKAIMTKLFFHKIKALAFDSSFSSSNLVATIVTYFNSNMNSVVIDAATSVNKIRAAVFHVENLTSLGSRNQYETPVFCRLNEPRPHTLFILISAL